MGKYEYNNSKRYAVFNPSTSSSGELCLGAFLVILFLPAASGLVKNSSLFAFAKASIINKV